MANIEAPARSEDFVERGLSAEEVLDRQRRGEVNRSAGHSSRSYRRILFDNAVNPVNVTLFLIAAGLVALGLASDAFLTAGLVAGNVLVGVLQESRAKHQLDRIALLTRPQATVVREGREQEIDPATIVRGDLLLITSGDQIQADGSVLVEGGLSLDESLLTGESDLVRKHAGDVVQSGTVVVTGQGRMVAEGIGAESLSQRITARARSFKNVRTPLQQEVSIVIRAMAVLVALLGIAVVNSFLHLYGDLPLVESTRAAAVVVALVPQGLWFMITVAYSMAVVRTTRSGVLIQRLNAVESLSRVDVLCLDKTGTLTTNRLNLETVEPIGIAEDELRRRLGRFAASASFKNRTTTTILEACPGEPEEVSAEIVFDSARKWSALLLPDGLYVMGAPEVLEGSLSGDYPQDAIEAWTSQGLRVLLFGHRDGAGLQLDELEPRLPDSILPLGFVVLRDELRSDASETARRFAAGGIGLKVISGDNPEAVAALALQAGFGSIQGIIAGPELAALSDDELPEVVERTTVFGRITPDDKERIVQALQRRGHYVAMIGDGVNDIPALKQAQLAVAMRSGSPATRGVADVVLLDDSFGALSTALLEGQRIRQGMEAIVRLFLVRTLSVAIIVLGAALAGLPFPLTPRQTAIIAGLSVGIPAMALAAWAKPGRGPQLLLPSALAFVWPASLVVGLASFVVYYAGMKLDASLETARTALTATSVLLGVSLIPYSVQSPNTWLTLAPLKQRLELALLTLVMLLIFVVASVVPVFRSFFEIEKLGLLDYLGVLAAVGVSLVLLKFLWHSGLDEWLESKTQRYLERRSW